MTRLFAILAATDGIFLLIAYSLGVISKLRGSLSHPEDSTFWYHFLFGLVTAVLTLLVHCLIFTYFLGTGRWVKEVKIAYDLPDAPLPRLTRDLKRKVFPPALFAMLTAIATGAIGAAAQVQLLRWEYHAIAATVTLLTNFWAFGVELRCLRTNGVVLVQVLEEVDRLRASRGLPTNAAALEEEG